MTEDCSKDGTQGGYHHVKFKDYPPESLQCPICLSVLKEPHLLSCCGCHICEVSEEGFYNAYNNCVLYSTVLNKLKLVHGHVLAVERKNM